MTTKQKINQVLYVAVMITALVLGGSSIYLRAIHIDETSMRVFVMYWREYVIAVSVFTALLIAYNKTVDTE